MDIQFPFPNSNEYTEILCHVSWCITDLSQRHVTSSRYAQRACNENKRLGTEDGEQCGKKAKQQLEKRILWVSNVDIILNHSILVLLVYLIDKLTLHYAACS